MEASKLGGSLEHGSSDFLSFMGITRPLGVSGACGVGSFFDTRLAGGQYKTAKVGEELDHVHVVLPWSSTATLKCL